MTEPTQPSRPRTRQPSARRVIDCAVHEPLNQRNVDRYVDPVWTGWHPIVPPLPYRIPAEGPRSVTYETIRDDVLDPSGAEIAVLSGTVHPGNAVTQLEYHSAFTSGYNDWLAAEWLSRDDRLYGSIQVMSQMPDQAAEEIDRMGPHPRMLQVVLPARGGEGFGLRKYRPIFEAAARHDLVVAFHISATTRAATGFPEYLAEWHAGASQSVMGQILSLVFSGLFDEHPNLKVLLAGGGWTWVPYLMWTMDSNYRPLRAEVPWVPKLPSEYFPDHLFFSVNPVPSGADRGHLQEMIQMAGHDGWLVWSSDYPNRGWATPDMLTRRGFSDELAGSILYDNAMRLYGARLERARAGTT